MGWKVASLLGILLAAQLVVASGNHNNSVWNITSDANVSGYHYNISEFILHPGVTITIEAYNGSDKGHLTINASKIYVYGTIDGNGRGLGGGSGGGGGQADDNDCSAGPVGSGGTPTDQNGTSGANGNTMVCNTRGGHGGGGGTGATGQSGGGGGTGGITIGGTGQTAAAAPANSDPTIAINATYGYGGGGGAGGACNLTDGNYSTNCKTGFTCFNSECIPEDSTDLEILNMRVIQTVLDVDMIKGKSGYVIINVTNNGPLNATARARAWFDGEELDFSSDTFSFANINPRMINVAESYLFVFEFKPEDSGTGVTVNATVEVVS